MSDEIASIRDKVAEVRAWGGWVHRRWEVKMNADDTYQLALMAKDLGLKQSNRPGRNAWQAISPKRRDGVRHVGYRQTDAETAIRSHALHDHSRMFSVPGRRGMQPGAILLQPYWCRELSKMGSALWMTLTKFNLAIRVIAHTPYNERTIGILLFKADDWELLDKLESSVGYVAPRERSYRP